MVDFLIAGHICGISVPFYTHTHTQYARFTVLPYSHKDGVYKHDSDSSGHIDYSMLEKPNPDDVSHMTYHVSDHMTCSPLTH